VTNVKRNRDIFVRMKLLLTGYPQKFLTTQKFITIYT